MVDPGMTLSIGRVICTRIQSTYTRTSGKNAHLEIHSNGSALVALLDLSLDGETGNNVKLLVLAMYRVRRC
jgi:hypothetical protein